MVDFRGALDFVASTIWVWLAHDSPGVTTNLMGEITWIWLDRGVATSSWSQLFQTIRVHHLPGSLSDHCPLWINLDDENVRFYKRNRPFRFEEVWLKDEHYKGVIKNAWESIASGSPMDRLTCKVDACRTHLQTWNRVSFGNSRSLLSQKRKLLAHADAWSMARGNHELVKILKGEVYEFMVKEDILWQQRSRVEWLKSGDFNTSYFHSHAT